MRLPIRPALALLSLSALLCACKDYPDVPAEPDGRLNRPYCNDPEAVNFNRDFPGYEDNGVCYYPADAFAGGWAFEDSIYDGTQKFIKSQTINFDIAPEDKLKFRLNGFCPGSGPAIAFTASRSLRADADTTAEKGQILCRETDTVSGYLAMPLFDSSKIRFFLTVISDTGTVFHRGTAYRR